MMKNLIYISYSHRDEAWKNRLLTHLKMQHIQDEQLAIRDERKVEPKSNWPAAMEKDLNNAGVVILLVSAAFLTSDFNLRIEVPRLLRRRAKEGLMIFPLIVSACAWQKVDWLNKLQVYPKNGNPLSEVTEYEIDEELANLAKDISSFLVAEDKTDREAPPPSNISISTHLNTGQYIAGRDIDVKHAAKVNIGIDINLSVDLLQLQDDFHDLRELLAESKPESKDALKEIQDSLDQLSAGKVAEDKDKMTSPMNKLRRFLTKLGDKDSDSHKVLTAGKKGIETVQKVARTYNKFAQWLALPQVPEVFLADK